MEKVTVAITNYNGIDHLPHCLRAVRDLDYADREVILVDNGSTDGSVDYARRHFPEVRILRLETNRGPGPARNLALREASTDLVFSIDNDAVVTPDCLRILVDAMRSNPGTTACQPRSLDAFRPDRIHYDGAYLHYLGVLSLRHFRARADGIATDAVPIDSLVAVAILWDRSRLPADCRFDEEFFFYFEEQDLSHRLRTRGGRFLMVPSAVVLHRHGTAGLSYRPGGVVSRRRAYYYTRNRWLLILKNYRLRTMLLVGPAFLLYELAWMFLLLGRGRFDMYVRGMLDVLRMGRGLRRERRRIQASRVVEDRDILRGEDLTFSVPDTGKPLQAAAVAGLNRLFRLYWRWVQAWI
jgi:GT2 family glycosyltransferase